MILNGCLHKFLISLWLPQIQVGSVQIKQRQKRSLNTLLAKKNMPEKHETGNKIQISNRQREKGFRGIKGKSKGL